MHGHGVRAHKQQLFEALGAETGATVSFGKLSKVFNKVEQVTSSYGEELAHNRKMHYADVAKRLGPSWKPADQAKSFPEPRFLKNYGVAMQPSIPEPPTRKGVEEKKKRAKSKGGHEKPWRAVPSTQSSRPVQSVVTKDLSRSYRGKV